MLSTNIDHYLVLPRQIGKTKSTIENILWIYIFSSNTKMMMLCKDSGGSKANLRTLKEQRDLLPLYMQCKFIINEDGEKKRAPGDNMTYLANPNNQNMITTATGGASEEAADRCGRGLTQAVQMYDEFEFTKHIGTIVDCAGPKLQAVFVIAKFNTIFVITWCGPLGSDTEKNNPFNCWKPSHETISSQAFEGSTTSRKA